MKRYDVKRYIKVLSGKLVDTSLILPHTECYFIEDCKLFAEQIDGTNVYLGKVICESNNLSELNNTK